MSTASRFPRLLRAMHTGGRRVPHSGMGGAAEKGPQGSVSPSVGQSTSIPPPSSGSAPDVSSVTVTSPADAAASGTSLSGPSSESAGTNDTEPPAPKKAPYMQEFTHKGKRVLVRPPRTTRVHLPSGMIEPEQYPPGPTYSDEYREESMKPAHPLWRFFYLTKPAQAKGMVDSDTDTPSEFGATPMSPVDLQEKPSSMRSWSAAELRQKSFADLHTLWYIILRERNVIATAREERRRLGIQRSFDGKFMSQKLSMCRKSMARIKYVLNERRLGLIATLAPKLDQRDPLPSWADPLGTQRALFNTLKPSQDIRYSKKVRQREAERVGEHEEDLQETQGTSENFVGDAHVAKEEVEARDEGFGGGEEAEKFVDETEIDDDGRVKKPE